jgi:hypothetical protein
MRDQQVLAFHICGHRFPMVNVTNKINKKYLPSIRAVLIEKPLNLYKGCKNFERMTACTQ